MPFLPVDRIDVKNVRTMFSRTWRRPVYISFYDMIFEKIWFTKENRVVQKFSCNILFRFVFGQLQFKILIICLYCPCLSVKRSIDIGSHTSSKNKYSEVEIITLLYFLVYNVINLFDFFRIQMSKVTRQSVCTSSYRL